MSYITGFLTPVKTENKDRYIESARKSWPLFQGYGATAQIENWGVDVPDGKLTSFPMAVKLEDGEAVVEIAPLRPNPVTQDEMDAGSIELF